MHTGIFVPLLTIPMLIFAIQTKAADILAANATISADERLVFPISCTTQFLSLDKVVVFSTTSSTIGRDDTFIVRIYNDCLTSNGVASLSSAGSVKEFVWWKGPLGWTTDRAQVCLEVQCTNWFLACNIKYDVIVNCQDVM